MEKTVTSVLIKTRRTVVVAILIAVGILIFFLAFVSGSGSGDILDFVI